MNTNPGNPGRKLTTWLFNPFVYIAGGQALLLGVGAILIAGLIGSASNTHFDGVLDLHSGARTALWFVLSEGFIDWLCLAGVLWVLGKVASKTSFRTIDVLGTQALARWPAIFMALMPLPKAFQRFCAYLADSLLKPGSKPVFSPSDALIFALAMVGIIVLTCWMVVLMYKAYSVSCNIKGGRAIGTFIGGLILAEILSKLALYGLLTFAGVSGGSPADARPSDFGTNAVAPSSQASHAIVGNWIGTLDAGGAKLRLQFRISQGADGLTAKMDSLDQNAHDIVVDRVEVKGDSVRLEVDSVAGVYEGKLDPAGTEMTGKWQQGPVTVPLVLQKKQGADGTGDYGVPAYARPDGFKEKDVVVGNGEWQLPGTLSMPVGNGPFPAVVLVHGSGPNDRDETVGANKPFRDLAWGLASRGVAVLRYEKRTRQYAGKVAKSIDGLTVNEETVADALEAVSLLRRNPGIATNRIFVLGHSLGGMVAPRIGARDLGVAGLIIMAGPARPMEDLILEQTLYQASLAGTLSAEAQQQIERVKATVAAIKNLNRSNPPPGLLLNAPAGYWLDLKDYSAPTAAKALSQPLLVLQGEEDCQVSFKTDFSLWRQILAERQDVTFKSYPALNHLFIAVTGKSTGAEYSQPGHVAEPVIADILAWIKSQPGKADRGNSITMASVAITPIPEKVSCAVPDRQDFQNPDRVILSGFVGRRIAGNESERLVKIDPAELLRSYRERPSLQSWDGEHVGKWLHAATLAWVNTGDPALRKKLDYIAAELCKCQFEDGYLGTYLDKDRWTEWDVWSHKYNLIGLITYMRYTGNMEPLPTCRKMGDLLCATFGDAPGKRDIITSGEHVGMAPTSVLEPMVLLYRLTGEPRYLDFCKYILRAWEQPNGPHIISRLLELKRVDKVGNGKAYEMLSCLNGALECYRTTGEEQILAACLNAWEDIVAKRLYITGATSYFEAFHDDYDLPSTGAVGETCATVSWLQFNAQLLRLTGEARFAEQLERVLLNQLPGAQSPDCTAWSTYPQMQGKKRYETILEGHCCLSSGPRGFALTPTFALTTDAEGVVVNLFDKANAKLNLRDQTAVSLTVDSLVPSEEHAHIAVDPSTTKAFKVKLRLPAWSPATVIKVNGQAVPAQAAADGYAAIARQWQKGDVIEVVFRLVPKIILGDHRNAGRVAVMYGPLVLAADDALLSSTGQTVFTISLPEDTDVIPEPAPSVVKTWDHSKVYHVSALASQSTGKIKAGDKIGVDLVPFADAGGTGSNYKVWLSLPGMISSDVLLGGKESRSREGNIKGSINDDGSTSYVVTYENTRVAEDWFAVTLDTPVSIKRIEFLHGNNFHDGGWFDSTKGKPRVQIQRDKDTAWETVGELTDYPKTTSADNGGLRSGQSFELKLTQAVNLRAIRVIGVPAGGDFPNQNFASCAALRAFRD